MEKTPLFSRLCLWYLRQMVAPIAPREKRSVHVPRLHISIRTKARELYVRQSLPAKEVAAACKLEEHQVRWLIAKYGWSKIRLEAEKRLAANIESNLDGLSAEISDTIAAECEEITLESLVRARESVKSLHKDAPKDFQAWTAGIRNLTTARNLARGKGEVNTLGGEDGRSVNLFFLNGGTKEMKVVETVDDVL